MLIPLVGMIAATGLVLMFVSRASTEEQEFWGSFHLIAMAIPLLYATGAGAVMVGQERETGTMEFLSALPIAPAKINNTKLFVSAIGLLALWIFVVAVTVFFARADTSRLAAGGILETASSSQPRWMLWTVHSVYVLLIGFYAAWRIRNVLLSVLATGVLATLPIALGFLYVPFVPTGVHEESVINAYTTLVSAVACVVAWWMMRRQARVMLSVVNAPAFDNRRSQKKNLDLGEGPCDFGSSFDAALWQYSNFRWSLAVLIASFVLGLVVTMLISGVSRGNGGLFGFALFLVCSIALATSWLGVSVFQHDGSSQGLRFFADRGFAPRRVFFYRHAGPATRVVVLLLIYTMVAVLLQKFTEILGRVAQGVNAEANLPSLAMMLILCVAVYSISQWASQLIKTPVIAYLLTPLIAFAGTLWLFICWSQFGVALWCVMLSALLPLYVSYRMMRRFMDQTDRVRSPVAAIGLVIVFVLIPMTYALTSRLSGWGITGWPLRVRTLVAIINDEDGGMPHQPTQLWHRSTYRDEWGGDFTTIEQAIASIRYRRQTGLDWIVGLDDIRESHASAAMIDRDDSDLYLARMNLARIRVASDESDAASNDEYRAWLSAAVDTAAALRRSYDISSQEEADRFEIWIADALANAVVDEFIHAQEVRELASRLPTPEQRNAARLESARNCLVILEPTSETLIRVAESLAAAKRLTESDLMRLHQTFYHPMTPFEIGVYGTRFRDRDAICSLADSGYRADWYPGRFWAMQWERDIEALREGNFELGDVAVINSSTTDNTTGEER
ncbi:ABC transporter permease [Aporhodopirellula aestuarii]|uniref:ABC transporter permease n=1 Tax=Aporhodopirellula aestuarii TaxID=2950107 RepID=A0ABT0TZQ7_9BACT|nr:ABC transporter permease [Aporhodopirellula aestuarii]MCM2370094.1 ABC transporter permease [Aporhodopirellula aestuarii]